MYAPAPEIQAYLASTAQKYNVNRFIKLRHEITSCNWNNTTSKWHVKIKNLEDGVEFEDVSDVLILARGGLNHIAWPEIEGFKSFGGRVMHSADRDESLVFPLQ